MIELSPQVLHIVLHHPEIPANTGNIGRLCVGTAATLHLIRPMRFMITDKELKRAGLDYWQDLKLEIHDSIDEIFERFPIDNIHLCTTKTTRCYTHVKYKPGDLFIFGAETQGLPPELLNQYPHRCIGIPMNPAVRSINLSNSVAIILYEAVRQIEKL